LFNVAYRLSVNVISDVSQLGDARPGVVDLHSNLRIIRVCVFLKTNVRDSLNESKSMVLVPFIPGEAECNDCCAQRNKRYDLGSPGYAVFLNLRSLHLRLPLWD
jgi:hypothetical protein